VTRLLLISRGPVNIIFHAPINFQQAAAVMVNMLLCDIITDRNAGIFHIRDCPGSVYAGTAVRNK
jgi:hypothetical protein